jgi:hypothetical protein
VPRLEALTADAHAFTRWTAVTSLKYAVTAGETRRSLRTRIESFIALIVDPNLSVRHAALVALNTVVHVEPALVQHLVLTVPDSAVVDLPEGKAAEPSAPAVRRSHCAHNQCDTCLDGCTCRRARARYHTLTRGRGRDTRG